ncbi:MAG TPA: nucleoside phosphorylase [Armatimonadetes bacterium]|nr:nucleoside phosphorylase [Armatimonadota bacterium]
MGERQYHLALGPGELAETVLLVGDPGRAERGADLFDEVRLERRQREFVTFTGTKEGRELSLLATGIGPDNLEIALLEACQITSSPTFIRVGTCGALQPEMELGDLVVTTGAVRLEDTSLWFVPPGYPAVAHLEVVLALVEAAERLGARYHLGLTASASGFYGAQGREVPGFPLRQPGIQEDLARRNVLNFEMESSVLFSLAALRGLRAGTVCVVYANRPRGTFVAPEDKIPLERTCLKVGFLAALLLAEMDAVKASAGARFWQPSLCLNSRKA